MLNQHHRVAERSLGGVVRRGDAFDGQERPERGPDLQEVVREPAVVFGAGALARGVLEQREELALDWFHLPGQAAAVLMLSERVPDGE
jgi:hypothetical protein